MGRHLRNAEPRAYGFAVARWSVAASLGATALSLLVARRRGLADTLMALPLVGPLTAAPLLFAAVSATLLRTQAPALLPPRGRRGALVAAVTVSVLATAVSFLLALSDRAALPLGGAR